MNDDSSLNPPAADPQGEGSSDNSELCVPIDSLSVDGTQPDIGDLVEVSVKGPVTKIRDNDAYIRVETVNDEPAKQGMSQSEPDNDDDQQLQSLMKQAGTIG